MLMAGALAEHGVEPQADEQRDQSEQDDLVGQPVSPGGDPIYIGAKA
jgi:hypothetical protein